MGINGEKAGHGHIERRECLNVRGPAYLEYLDGLPGRCRRVVWAAVVGPTGPPSGDGTGITVQSRNYITSLEGSAQRLLELSRAHWNIENSLHWSMNVTFREDQSRCAKTTAHRFCPHSGKFHTIC